MVHRAVILLLCLLGFLQKGLAAVIETQQTVMAAVGEEALLNCQLMQPKDVLQVTWQKILPEGVKNIATYTEYFGEKVNPDFRDKVEFKYAGLQNSSIVIKRVMEEDEGCYHCLFNTYPDGALTGSTCLQLYGVDEESGSVNSDLNVTLITVLVVVSCVCVAATVIIIILLIRKHQNRDSEENRTPRRTTKDTQPKTPLLIQENEVRQQMSPGKNKENGSPKE
ncbi:OX-2 membrane glycoprotein-like isoform X2 [Epinephelus lanceolatus]